MTSRFIATRISACVMASASFAAVAAAQSTGPAASLPPIEVTTKATKAQAKKANAAQAAPAKAKPVVPTAVPPSAQAARALTGSPSQRSGALTSPDTAEARAEIQRTPGAVAVVPDTAYKASTPAVTIKDALDYVPGVFVQPKWGEDTRLSIRGSGLSRNFHGRGVYLLMDGIIPVSTADGSSDFQEIDPTAYRYIEVFKGGNALRYGGTQLGGAINFVMPTGYDSDTFGTRVDVGSFGFRKTAVRSGGVYGNTDYFITGTWQEQEGFRDHSDAWSVRGAMNVGYRLTPDIETRFYFNANQVRQDIPGAVTKRNALNNPKGAFVNPAASVNGNDNVDRDFERNLDTLRVANRTAIRLGSGTLLEAGGFFFDRQLDHPISIVVDQDTQNYGGFARLTTDSVIGGFRNLFTGGATVHNGETHGRIFANVRGQKGALSTDTNQTSDNTVVYAENSFFVLPTVAFVGGLQYVKAVRDQDDLLPFVGGDSSYKAEFDFWNPKGGIVWDIATNAQIFGNISRSGEAPTFNETNPADPLVLLKPQRATTYEIGTRGFYPDFYWDIALYRSHVEDEFQCLDAAGTGTCTQTNIDQTIHQGVELGVGGALLRGLFVDSAYTPDKLWLNLAYTFSDFRFDNDRNFGDNELAGAPRHYLRAELLYKHPSGIFAGPNVEWVPDAYYADNKNTFETEAYAIWGAKIGYEGERFTAYIEGRNLADEAYIASASISNDLAGLDRNVFEPGTGRAIYGGVSVKW
jgi:iron complex outermembrane receptor protein